MFITSFAPKSLYFPFPLTSVNNTLLSALLTSSESLHFSPSRCRDYNEFRTSMKTASRSKMMACSSIQNHVMLKVVKNLFSLLCSELCSTFSPTRNSQVCFTKHLNCCSSEADNEALTCYLREAGFISCAQTVPNTDSIKTTFAILTPAYIRTLKTRLQSLSRHIPLPAVSQNIARCPLSVFQK